MYFIKTSLFADNMYFVSVKVIVWFSSFIFLFLYFLCNVFLALSTQWEFNLIGKRYIFWFIIIY